MIDFCGKGLAQKYEKKVTAAYDLDEKLGQAVMNGYFCVLYRKDEYEVARLHLNYLNKSLEKTFSSYKRLKFHLAPPLLSFGKRNFRPKKYVFGEWVLLLFKVLVMLKPLRNTRFDFFGMSRERKLEKKLITLYETDLTFIFKNFSKKNQSVLLNLAENPLNVKGFGLVKETAIKEAFDSRLELLAKFK